jgi:hypothetical protein
MNTNFQFLEKEFTVFYDRAHKAEQISNYRSTCFIILCTDGCTTQQADVIFKIVGDFNEAN